jgi:hypothetical protein
MGVDLRKGRSYFAQIEGRIGSIRQNFFWGSGRPKLDAEPRSLPGLPLRDPRGRSAGRGSLGVTPAAISVIAALFAGGWFVGTAATSPAVAQTTVPPSASAQGASADAGVEASSADDPGGTPSDDEIPAPDTPGDVESDAPDAESASGADDPGFAESDTAAADSQPTGDGEWRVGAAVSAWTRFFPQSPMWPGQLEGAFWPYFEGWLKAEYAWNGGNDRIVFKPYGRLDTRGSRSVVDLREAYYLHVDDTWDFLFGFNTVRWGVVESRRLVNIVNQVDIAWDIDGNEVLGQPMANLNLNIGQLGTLSLFGLFGFRERHDPEIEDRLRFPLVAGPSVFEASDLERNVNFAARFTTNFPIFNGSVDAAVSYFHGIGREPRYLLQPNFPTGLPPGFGVPVELGALIFSQLPSKFPPGLFNLVKLTPIYDVIDQGGVEFVGTFGDLQVKFEGILRSENDEQFTASVTGLEYTFYDVMGSGKDIGLFGEWTVDNRSIFEPPTIYDHDIFFGTRVALNDVGSTNLLLGFLYDYKDPERYVAGVFSTRLQDDLLLEIEGRYFFPVDPPVPTFAVKSDSYLQGRLTKFF